MVAEPVALIDTGPIVAVLDRAEAHHSWTVEIFKTLPAPLLTSESVLSEACFLLHSAGLGADPLLKMLESGTLAVVFDLQTEHDAIATLMRKYRQLPMSLADAGLVRLAEIHDRASVMTMDRHFKIYRKHGRRQIPLICPPNLG